MGCNEMLVTDIWDSGLLKMFPELLDKLLYDNTTKKNIIWATSNYEKRGKEYSPNKEIKTTLININPKSKIIKPRVEKSKTEQLKRIKSNAEVFTPVWIVNKQNNLVDDAWFENKNIFNIEQENNTWVTTEKVIFAKNKTWQEYVTDIRLEVCCGEAPYLVSRYDAVSGDAIELKNRVGLLDRKFRVINENAKTDDEWIEYSIKAIKSVYGYEFQGDNLVIARCNVLLDYLDYYFDKFKSWPTKDLIFDITNIISWNLWQMDGLKYVVPLSCHNVIKKTVQLSLFEEISDPKPELCPGCKSEDPKLHNGKRCYIMDWETDRKIKFVSLIWRNDYEG